MPQITNSETLSVRGECDVSSGTLTLKNDQISRTKISREDLAVCVVLLDTLKTWDDLSADLPGTAAADDLGIIEGTWGTDVPTVQSSDADSTTVTQYARFMIPIDNSYIEGETIEIRIRGGMITNVADTSATVDLEVYVPDGDGAVGSDLCATAAQSINSLSKANKDFTITSASIVQGDVLDCRVTVAITDAATGAAVIGEISSIKMLRDIRA